MLALRIPRQGSPFAAISAGVAGQQPCDPWLRQVRCRPEGQTPKRPQPVSGVSALKFGKRGRCSCAIGTRQRKYVGPWSPVPHMGPHCQAKPPHLFPPGGISSPASHIIARHLSPASFSFSACPATTTLGSIRPRPIVPLYLAPVVRANHADAASFYNSSPAQTPAHCHVRNRRTSRNPRDSWAERTRQLAEPVPQAWLCGRLTLFLLVGC